MQELPEGRAQDPRYRSAIPVSLPGQGTIKKENDETGPLVMVAVPSGWE